MTRTAVAATLLVLGGCAGDVSEQTADAPAEVREAAALATTEPAELDPTPPSLPTPWQTSPDILNIPHPHGGVIAVFALGEACPPGGWEARIGADGRVEVRFRSAMLVLPARRQFIDNSCMLDLFVTGHGERQVSVGYVSTRSQAVLAQDVIARIGGEVEVSGNRAPRRLEPFGARGPFEGALGIGWVVHARGEEVWTACDTAGRIGVTLEYSLSNAPARGGVGVLNLSASEEDLPTFRFELRTRACTRTPRTTAEGGAATPAADAWDSAGSDLLPPVAPPSAVGTVGTNDPVPEPPRPRVPTPAPATSTFPAGVAVTSP